MFIIKNDPNDSIIAANIRRLRNERNWSQPSFAQVMKVTRAAVSKWECGRHISLPLLFKLSEIFRVPVEEFFYGLLAEPYLDTVLSPKPGKPRRVDPRQIKIIRIDLSTEQGAIDFGDLIS